MTEPADSTPEESLFGINVEWPRPKYVQRPLSREMMTDFLAKLAELDRTPPPPPRYFLPADLALEMYGNALTPEQRKMLRESGTRTVMVTE